MTGGTRGGRRQGAGRKARGEGPKVGVKVYFTQEELDYLKVRGRGYAALALQEMTREAMGCSVPPPEQGVREAPRAPREANTGPQTASGTPKALAPHPGAGKGPPEPTTPAVTHPPDPPGGAPLPVAPRVCAACLRENAGVPRLGCPACRRLRLGG